jgi:hypothetical protein
MNDFQVIYGLIILVIVFILGKYYQNEIINHIIKRWKSKHEKSRLGKKGEKAVEGFKVGEADLQKFKDDLKNSNNGKHRRGSK